MSRATYVFREGHGFVVKGGPLDRRAPAPSRSDLPCPMLIRDNMDALLNHADGRYYDSKSAFTKAVKAAGCEILGNDAPTTPVDRPPPDGVDDAVEQAIAKVSQGYKPSPKIEHGAPTETGWL